MRKAKHLSRTPLRPFTATGLKGRILFKIELVY